MSWDDLIEWLLLPPGGLLLLGVLGLMLWKRRLGRVLVGVALLCLWVLSTPILAYPLIDAAQWYPVFDPKAPHEAQAIVVLGGGRRLGAPDWGDTVSSDSLERVRYAAKLQRETGLPLIVTGGQPDRAGAAVGTLMTEVLEREYQVPVLLTEADSRNTYENAAFTYALLEPRGLRRVIVVTDARHMRRSLTVFRQVGFEPIPAPTDYVTREHGARAFFPHTHALHDSFAALHEHVGRLYYWLRY